MAKKPLLSVTSAISEEGGGGRGGNGRGRARRRILAESEEEDEEEEEAENKEGETRQGDQELGARARTASCKQEAEKQRGGGERKVTTSTKDVKAKREQARGNRSAIHAIYFEEEDRLRAQGLLPDPKTMSRRRMRSFNNDEDEDDDDDDDEDEGWTRRVKWDVTRADIVAAIPELNRFLGSKHARDLEKARGEVLSLSHAPHDPAISLWQS